MRFLSWLRNSKTAQEHASGRGYGAARPGATFRPRLEALEDRFVPTTLRVTNLNDSGPGSLRYEIAQAANRGDTIAFDSTLSNRTITLTSGELVINKSLTIKGQGEAITSEYYEDNLFDILPGSRIFEVSAGAAVAISGLTIDGGGGTRYGNGGVSGTPYDGYGGAILNFGTLTLSSCYLGGPTGDVPVQYNAAQYGGAIANFGTMTVSSCFIVGNHASEGGGGIYNAGTAGALTVSKSTFSGNSPDAIFGPYQDGGRNKFR
jgi:hypothetical protein